MNDESMSWLMVWIWFREARLSISPIETTDEGEYKCEITFLGEIFHSFILQSVDC